MQTEGRKKLKKLNIIMKKSITMKSSLSPKMNKCKTKISKQFLKMKMKKKKNKMINLFKGTCWIVEKVRQDIRRLIGEGSFRIAILSIQLLL